MPTTFASRSALAVGAALSALLCFGTAAAQGSRADYERAATIGERFREAYREAGGDAPIRPEWLDATRCWYLLAEPGLGRRWWLVETTGGTRTPLFDHERVAAGIAALTGASVQPGDLPIERLAVVGADEGAGDALLALIGGHDRALRIERRGEVSWAPAATADRFALRPLAAPAPSRGGGGETSIRFANRTAAPLRLVWVDPQGARREYARLEPGRSHAQHTFAGHVWVAVADDGRDIASFVAEDRPSIAAIDGQIAEPQPAAPAEAPRREPSVALRTFIRDHNVFVEDPDGEPVALTTDGVEGDAYSRPIASPDGTRVLALRTRRGDARKVWCIESAPKSQLQPKLHHFEYPKPGDPWPAQRPCLLDVATRRPIPVAEAPFQDAWALDALRWEPDSSRATLLFNPRGHRGQQVLAIDARTGAVAALVDERCETFFDYASKRFLHFTQESGELIWMSERDGWNHLYLIDARTGEVRNQITRGAWAVRSVERVDEQARQVWFRAGGLWPGQDPYHVHWARVNFDGSGLLLLTEGDGTHEVSFSPDGAHFVDRYSRPDLPPRTELRRSADGSLVQTLGAVDAAPLLAAGWSAPQRFVAKGRDGVTDIHGLIHRPTSFEPGQPHPVIEAIYAGPHGAHVPKSFRADSDVLQLVELGFIVVQIDGMGTNFRSKAFHDVAWRNLRDAGLPDRIAWLRAASAAHPELDLHNRGRGVGIYGGSAGGQNAVAALLWHGDFYKAAAADCGCHDNRMDKIWWNELWMSWPVGAWYEQSSNVANAHLLPADCSLLLTVGELDQNVDPASTMQLAAALQRADKDFELLVLTGMGHGAGESPYGRRRRQDFFVRTLMGRTPRWVEPATR